MMTDMGDTFNFLLLATAAACLFLHFQRRAFFTVRPLIKAGMGILLALACAVAAPSPLILMALGFALSAFGDWFLDFPEDQYFLPGLISFFLAHLSYLIYLWPHAQWSLPICLLVSLFSLGYFIWLKPALDQELVIPVALYSVIIALMGMAALTTTLPTALIAIGAVLFIASDVVLAIEKFKFKFWQDKTLNWLLYASGQIVLAAGVLSTI